MATGIIPAIDGVLAKATDAVAGITAAARASPQEEEDHSADLSVTMVRLAEGQTIGRSWADSADRKELLHRVSKLSNNPNRLAQMKASVSRREIQILSGVNEKDIHRLSVRSSPQKTPRIAGQEGIDIELDEKHQDEAFNEEDDEDEAPQLVVKDVQRKASIAPPPAGATTAPVVPTVVNTAVHGASAPAAKGGAKAAAKGAVEAKADVPPKLLLLDNPHAATIAEALANVVGHPLLTFSDPTLDSDNQVAQSVQVLDAAFNQIFGGFHKLAMATPESVSYAYPEAVMQLMRLRAALDARAPVYHHSHYAPGRFASIGHFNAWSDDIQNKYAEMAVKVQSRIHGGVVADTAAVVESLVVVTRSLWLCCCPVQEPRYTGYDSDSELSNAEGQVAQAMTASGRNLWMHQPTPRQLFPLLLKIVLQFHNQDMIIPDQASVAGICDLKSTSIQAVTAAKAVADTPTGGIPASKRHAIGRPISAEHLRLLSEYCFYFRISPIVLQATLLQVLVQNLEGAFQENAQRPNPELVGHLAQVAATAAQCRQMVKQASHAVSDMEMVLTGTSAALPLLRAAISKFDQVFALNQPTDGLNKCIAAYKAVYELQIQCASTVGTLSPKPVRPFNMEIRELMLQSAVRRYGEFKATVLSELIVEQLNEESLEGGNETALVSVDVLIPSSEILQVKDVMGRTVVATLKNYHNTILELRIGDVITAVNGEPVAHMAAADVQNLLDTINGSLTLSVQGMRTSSESQAQFGDMTRADAFDGPLPPPTHCTVVVDDGVNLLGIGANSDPTRPQRDALQVAISGRFRPYVCVGFEGGEMSRTPSTVGLIKAKWNGSRVDCVLPDGNLGLLHIQIRDSAQRGGATPGGAGDTPAVFDKDYLIACADLIIDASRCTASESHAYSVQPATLKLPLFLLEAGCRSSYPALYQFDGRQLIPLAAANVMADAIHSSQFAGYLNVRILLTHNRARANHRRGEDGASSVGSSDFSHRLTSTGVLVLLEKVSGDFDLTGALYNSSFTSIPFDDNQSYAEFHARQLYGMLRPDVEHYVRNIPIGQSAPPKGLFQIFQELSKLHRRLQSLGLDQTECINTRELFSRHVPSWIESMHTYATKTFLPRFVVQESLVPLSKKLRHSDSVQVLFKLCYTYLEMFQEYSTGSNPDHVARFARRLLVEPVLQFAGQQHDAALSQLSLTTSGGQLTKFLTEAAGDEGALAAASAFCLRLNNIYTCLQKLPDVIGYLNVLDDVNLKDDSDSDEDDSDDDGTVGEHEDDSSDDERKNAHAPAPPPRRPSATPGSAGGVSESKAGTATAPKAQSGRSALSGRTLVRAVTVYTVDLTIQSAKNLPKLDGVGLLALASDPYVICKVATSEAEMKEGICDRVQTKIIWSTTAPVWNQAFALVTGSPDAVIVAEVYDYDADDTHDYIGGAKFTLKQFLDQGVVNLRVGLKLDGDLTVTPVPLVKGVPSQAVTQYGRGTIDISIKFSQQVLDQPAANVLKSLLHEPITKFVCVMYDRLYPLLNSLFAAKSGVERTPEGRITTATVTKLLQPVLYLLNEQFRILHSLLYKEVFQSLLCDLWQAICAHVVHLIAPNAQVTDVALVSHSQKGEQATGAFRQLFQRGPTTTGTLSEYTVPIVTEVYPQLRTFFDCSGKGVVPELADRLAQPLLSMLALCSLPIPQLWAKATELRNSAQKVGKSWSEWSSPEGMKPEHVIAVVELRTLYMGTASDHAEAKKLLKEMKTW